MTEFFGFMKMFVLCGTVFFIIMTVLLALPQSRLRSVGLEMSKWALMCGLLLMVPSPIDVLPDVLPGIGWLDDIGYVIAAIMSGRSAVAERKKRSALEELEFRRTMAQKRDPKPASDNGKQKEAA